MLALRILKMSQRIFVKVKLFNLAKFRPQIVFLQLFALFVSNLISLGLSLIQIGATRLAQSGSHHK